jgi:hypothetical protein
VTRGRALRDGPESLQLVTSPVRLTELQSQRLEGEGEGRKGRGLYTWGKWSASRIEGPGVPGLGKAAPRFAVNRVTGQAAQSKPPRPTLKTDGHGANPPVTRRGLHTNMRAI